MIALRHAVAQDERKRVTVTLALAAEVKRSTNKPWIVFTSEHDRSQVQVNPNLFLTVLARLNLQEIWFHELYATHPLANFDRLGRVAYQSFLGAQNTDKDRSAGYGNQTFSALVSCFKATSEIIGYLQSADRNPLRDPQTGHKTYEIGISHGLFVVHGGLFEAIVSSPDRVDVIPAEHLPYVFNYASKEYGNKTMLMDFVTLEHLPMYLKTYGDWLDERANFCLRELS